MRPVDRVLAIAHRGASADRPENTVAAFDEALRQGCDGIELDLQLTRDGVPVVYHDRTLLRAGGGLRGVGARTLNELRRLDPGSRFDPRFRGERIPTLGEVLDRYGGRVLLLLEIKRRGPRTRWLELLRETTRELQRRGLEERALLLCFDLALLLEASRLAPTVRRVLNLEPRGPLEREIRHQAAELSWLSAEVSRIEPRFVASVRELGLPLMTYSCNTEEQVETSLSAGATGMMTDRPGWLVGQLRRHGRIA